MSVKSILQTNDLVAIAGAARMEMADTLGDGPYIIEFTEETDGNGSSGTINVENVIEVEGGAKMILKGDFGEAPYEIEVAEGDGELPEGGSTGQILAKKSGNDYDVEWIDNEGSSELIAGITINGKPLSGQIINLTAADVGALSATGTAVAASKLATARTVRTNLASTTAASFDGTSNIAPGVTGTLSVSNGGTGLNTLTSGYALIGNGTSAVGLRAITNNTSTTTAITASQNLVTMNTLRYALNRTTGIESSDTNYSTAMVRAIKAGTSKLTAGSSALTSGTIYLVYK